MNFSRCFYTTGRLNFSKYGRNKKIPLLLQWNFWFLSSYETSWWDLSGIIDFFFVSPLSLFVRRDNFEKPSSSSILSTVLKLIFMFSDNNWLLMSSADRFCFLSKIIFLFASSDVFLSFGPGFFSGKKISFPCLKSLIWHSRGYRIFRIISIAIDYIYYIIINYSV